MDRKGICTAGNLLVDIMYRVERYPGRGELTSILGPREMAVGGLACNTALSLSMLDISLPIHVCGILGEDAEGQLVRTHFARRPNIRTAGILTGEQTSYTVVMNDQGTNERSFFVSRGSGDDFDVDDVDLDSLDVRIFHAGYVLLLAALDREDARYGTRMARLLAMARERGMRTSIDVVSESGDRFRRLVPAALRHTDYCIINELEAQQISGICLRASGTGELLSHNMQETLHKLKRLGVAHWAAIHCPEGSFGLDEQGRYISLPSIALPDGYIRSTTGAGDAFCAGVLYGAHEGWALLDGLRLGTATAALSLGGADSYATILPVPEAMDFYRRMGGS